MPFLQNYLQETIVATNLECQSTPSESQSDQDFYRLIGALDDIRVGFKKEESTDDILGAKGDYSGGVLPLGIMAGGEDYGMRFLKVYRDEKGEEVKLLNLRGGGDNGGDSREGGVDLGDRNPYEDLKSCVKYEHDVEGQDGEAGGVTLPREYGGIEGGVKLSKEPNHPDETDGLFSQEFECYEEGEDMSEGSIEIFKVPEANDCRGRTLSRKNLYEHRRHRRVAPPIKSGYESDGEDEGEEGENGVCLPHEDIRLCNKCQSQYEDQDLDDGGVSLSEEGWGIEHEEVELFDESSSEEESVGLPLEFDYEKEGVDGHQDSLEFTQETDNDDGDRRENEMNLPQQHKNLNHREAEGVTFFQEDRDAKPSLAYQRLLAHFLV